MADNKLIKQSLAFRAKYRTKREDMAGGMRNLYAWQIVPHPMSSMGGEPIRVSRTKALVEDILSNGYDPSEAHVDSVVVEAAVDGAGVPMKTFAEHGRQVQAWPALMDEVEEFSHHLPELVSAVAEKNPKLTKEQVEREGLKWRSQLEIKLISEIIAAPNVEPAKLKEQEADMRVKLAELIATKLLELAKWADIYGEAENIITASWGGDLMKTALQNFRSPRWRVEHGVESLKATAAEAAEASDVIRNDEHNQPQTDVARISIAPEIEEVEQIPWAEWLKAVVTADFYDEFLARSVFSACLTVAS